MNWDIATGMVWGFAIGLLIMLYPLYGFMVAGICLLYALLQIHKHS